MVMTEKMLEEFTLAVGKRVRRRVKAELPHIHKLSRAHIEKIAIKETEEEARNFISIGTFPPANFPAWLIHDSDYYGEGLAPKLQLDTTFGWNGEV